MTFITNDEWAQRKYYEYFIAFSVQTVAKANLTTGDYFIYFDGSGNSYYVWMDFNSDGSTDDPGPVANYTGVPVDVSAITTADEIAEAIATEIDALTYSSAIFIDDIITITNVSNDDLSKLIDSTNNQTEFTITNLGYLAENDLVTAKQLTLFREDAKGEINQWLVDDPTSGNDLKFCKSLEFRTVELMIDSEAARNNQQARNQFVAVDWIGTRDRMKLLAMNTISGRRTAH